MNETTPSQTQANAPLQPIDSSGATDQNLDFSLEGLFRQTWAIFTKHLGRWLGVVFIPVIAYSIITILLILFLVLLFLPLSQQGNLDSPNQFFDFIKSNALSLTLVTALFFIVYLVIQFWSQVALFYAILKHQEKIKVIDIYKQSFKKIKPFIWLSFLSGMIVLGGFALGVIPGFLLAVWFIPVAWVFMIENETGLRALIKAKEYVRGRWWAVAGRMSVAALVFMIINSIISRLNISGYEASDNQFGFMPLSLTIYLVTLLISPLITIYSYVLYRNLITLRGPFDFTPSNKAKNYLMFFFVIGIFFIGLFTMGIIGLINLIRSIPQI